MGAAYRPVDLRIDWRDAAGFHELTRHIHNGHLWILLQSGLLGYLSFVWLSLLFLVRGFRNWRRVSDHKMRGVLLGFTLVYLVVVIAAGANSSFMQWGWTPVFGILLGVNEIILRNYRSNQAAGRDGVRVGL
jgi:O-antigen ligase